MIYFTSDFVNFFKELSSNNNKEWFHEQKPRYEKSVKKPFENFVADVILEINKRGAGITCVAKDCILRINRDIRFSKDKTPYNLHRTAFISKGGRKDKSIPGLFIRLTPEMVGVMGGCFGPDKGQLKAIRDAIARDPKMINKLIGAKAFKEKFGEMKGDKMKRIPKEYVEAAAKEPLILNKQYYFTAEENPGLITSESLMDVLLEYYDAMKPLNRYLEKVIGGIN